MLKKIIALEGIEIVAPVGYYEEERKRKNTFLIDVSVETDFDENDTDEINHTVNYEILFAIVEKEMQVECKLLENVAHRIYTAIMKLDDSLSAVTVVIRKKNPPLKGDVKASKVELHWTK